MYYGFNPMSMFYTNDLSFPINSKSVKCSQTKYQNSLVSIPEDYKKVRLPDLTDSLNDI